MVEDHKELKGDYVFVQTEFQEHREEYHGFLGHVNGVQAFTVKLRGGSP